MLHHLVFEVVDNSVDEATVEVVMTILHASGKCGAGWVPHARAADPVYSCPSKILLVKPPG
ncbi:hypothetical protein [Arthrobacter sp. B1I2]|uniref:hypothetical protein n=1 Tax=Arthrobacter sp. B1I2 TaxID=3042263 RepID=UPI00277FEBAA|nr:hypothetical protein [Arthrobacter sp. B1I2]MDQ0733235.1 hypothetical protein [Arthrobacter sp. B1I2]